MSDYASSLPVRTQNPGDVVAKIADATTPSQQLAVTAAGEAKVDVTSSADFGSASGGTAATSSGLAGGIFNTSPPTLTNGQQSALQLDSSGNLDVNLKTALPSGANTIGSVNQGTSPWVTSDLADGSVSGGTAGTKSMLAGGVFNTSAPTLTNGQQASLQLDSSGNLDVNLKTALPAGANLIGAVNLDIGGTAVSPTNPVPVYLQDGGTSINNYNTAAALAAAGTSNHDYTVTAAKTLHLSQIHASASGKLKIEVQLETAAGSGTFNSIFVGFNSTATPNIDIPLSAEADQVAGARVRIIRTNEDVSAMDVYSTISGHEQ